MNAPSLPRTTTVDDCNFTRHIGYNMSVIGSRWFRIAQISLNQEISYTETGGALMLKSGDVGD